MTKVIAVCPGVRRKITDVGYPLRPYRYEYRVDITRPANHVRPLVREPAENQFRGLRRVEDARPLNACPWPKPAA